MKNKTRRNSYSFNFKSTLQKKMPVRIPLSLFVQKICWSFRRSWSWPTQCRKMVQKVVCDNFKLTHAKKMGRAKGGGRKLKYPEMDGSWSFTFIYFYWWIVVSANTKGVSFSEFWFWRLTSKSSCSIKYFFEKK